MSVPSVFTVVFPLSLVLFIKMLVTVTLLEWEMRECQNWDWDHDSPSTSRFVEL